VRVVEGPVEVPVRTAPTRRGWLPLLGALAGQIDHGRIYDRDLPDLSDALDTVLDAYRRRGHGSALTLLMP
jgi:hypothetical protein